MDYIDKNNTIVAYIAPIKTVYKGLTIECNTLYVADFHNNKIDTFNGNFILQSSYKFIDPNLPIGYAPFNIININCYLYILYAMNNGNDDNISRSGLGIINIFDYNGNFIKRFITGGELNAPWSIIYSPFNNKCEEFLIGNFGDGYINRYLIESGMFIEKLNINSIDGLWQLVLDKNMEDIYFSAGPNAETEGFVGKIIEKCS